MLVLKSSYEKLKKQLESERAFNKTMLESKELENEQNESLFNKIQSQKKQIEGLQEIVQLKERVSKKYLKLKKTDLLEELILKTIQTDELNNIIDDLQQAKLNEAVISVALNQDLLEKFKKMVADLPNNTRGVCYIKKDKEAECVEITNKLHAEEIIKRCESGEWEFVG